MKPSTFILILFTLCGCVVQPVVKDSLTTQPPSFPSPLALDPPLPGGAPKPESRIQNPEVRPPTSDLRTLSSFSSSVIQPPPSASIRMLPGCVELIWDPISNAVNVYCGNASHSYERLIPAGTNNTALIDGLNAGQTYYFAVTAVDEFGVESDFSAELKTPPWTVLELNFPDGQPFTRIESSTDLVNWNPRPALQLATPNLQPETFKWHLAMHPELKQEFFRAAQ